MHSGNFKFPCKDSLVKGKERERRKEMRDWRTVKFYSCGAMFWLNPISGASFLLNWTLHFILNCNVRIWLYICMQKFFIHGRYFLLFDFANIQSFVQLFRKYLVRQIRRYYKHLERLNTNFDFLAGRVQAKKTLIQAKETI